MDSFFPLRHHLIPLLATRRITKEDDNDGSYHNNQPKRKEKEAHVSLKKSKVRFRGSAPSPSSCVGVVSNNPLSGGFNDFL